MLKIMISTKLMKEKKNIHITKTIIMKMIKNKKKKKKNKRIRIITKVKNDSGISIKEELNHKIYIYRYIYTD